ncbi:hypothetical protein SOCEGT47_065250 [Sorangium cellulosum]|uniref:Uncharacterized protein n=1 Tax=Sorangium cellulosum TaxID=56 RepID=A0A4V0NEF3_SORCE|nr:putative metal-binding motif-containing protein [Sorangium cellulosum]AUX25972.1 hypothetical protein SOCEGT47_065250 [Sorangium cellulosum]
MRAWLKFLSFMTVTGCLGVSCTGRIGPAGGLLSGGGGGADSTGAGGATGTTADTTITTSGSGGGSTPATTSGGGSAGGGGGADCGGSPDDDADGDGFSEDEGDCDDCNPRVNPRALELPTVGGEGGDAPEPVDDDCDGIPDNVPEPCDGDLAIDDPDPLNAARAIELCAMSSDPARWGVVSATWMKVDGSAPPEAAEKLTGFHLGHGILDGFGPNVAPRGGARLLALSSGAARQDTDPDFQSPSGFAKGYSGDLPRGFPRSPRGCVDFLPGRPEDPIAVEITIRVPSNVHGFSFNTKYNTFDWPDVVCSSFNDFFLALLSPAPPDRIDGHLLFDHEENAMSLNNAFIDVCKCQGGSPCELGGRSFACSLGLRELLGTGFENRAATGWLVTTAPVEPGQEIKIRWGVYDAGDGTLDSTGLIDNWQWIVEPGVPVKTMVAPPPAAEE